MPIFPAVHCAQVGLGQIPSHFRSHSSSDHAQNVHMVVLDTLPGREMVVDERSPDTFHLIGANGCTHPAAADRNATIHFTGSHCVRQRDNEVRIVVAWIEAVCAKVSDHMASGSQFRNQLFLESESSVIAGNAYFHAMSIALQH